jgi:hypothetical protein
VFFFSLRLFLLLAASFYPRLATASHAPVDSLVGRGDGAFILRSAATMLTSWTDADHLLKGRPRISKVYETLC